MELGFKQLFCSKLNQYLRFVSFNCYLDILFQKASAMKNLLFIPLLILLQACEWLGDDFKKPEPTLPPITTTGEGTFGCLVNGELWLPEADQFEIDLNADYSNGQFFLSAKNENTKPRSRMGFFSEKNTVYTSGLQMLNSDSVKAVFLGDCEYEELDILAGELNISRLDSQVHIFSGTFFFTAIKPDCDTIRVTDGRFDIFY